MTKPRALIIVDTLEMISLDLRQALDNLGYVTELILSNEVTPYQLVYIRPDIILLHIEQPVLSNTIPYQSFKSDRNLKEIPVVALAAYQEIADQLSPFVDIVLTRPINYERLANLIPLLCSIDKPGDQTPWEPITGFYTPSYFVARLNQAIQKSLQDKMSDFIVFSIGLDQLQKDENNFGQKDWQKILHTAVRVIKKVLRATDIISHFESDRFLILIENVVDQHATISIAERVQRELDKFLIGSGIKDRRIIGIGVLYCNGEYKTFDEVLRDVQLAVELAQEEFPARHMVAQETQQAHYFMGNKSLYSV